MTVSEFVFSHDPTGAQPWLPNWVTKQFIEHRRRAGLSHFRLHDLRHFMATEMLGRGVPVPTVSQRLGHARASTTTLNVYAHRIPGSDRQAANLLGTLISGGRGERWISDLIEAGEELHLVTRRQAHHVVTERASRSVNGA